MARSTIPPNFPNVLKDLNLNVSIGFHLVVIHNMIEITKEQDRYLNTRLHTPKPRKANTMASIDAAILAIIFIVASFLNSNFF